MALADNMPNDRPGDQARRVADLERAVRELQAARSLDAATITAAAGLGVRTSDFDGTDFAHPGTQGNYFGGDGLVANSLYLRPGSIGNDILTNPVAPDDVSFGVDTFTVTAGTYTLLGSASRTVPAGYTKALVNASAWMFARNSNTTGGVDGTGTDAIYCFVRVSGSDGDTDSRPKGQGISGFGGFTTATSGVGKLKTGLTPGSSLTFKVYGASASQDLSADAQNTADLMGTVLWLR